jgi:hypothetical protein
VKAHPDSAVQLHPLYHRKEGGKYIIGNPETGEFMIITPAEFRALQLLHSDLAIKHAEELLAKEKDRVDLHSFIRELKEHGFVHKIGNRVITSSHEPLHEMQFNVKWLGGRPAAFLYLLLSLFGVWTLIWRGDIPGYQVFFYQPHLSLMLIVVIGFAWLLVAFRQLVKYASAQSLGVTARFGFSNSYHLFIPRVYLPKMSEQQEHRVLGLSLLSLTALTSAALLFATYLAYPYNLFWSMIFTIGFIELLAECLLFLDTDLSRFITINVNIHKLNKQTAQVLREDWKQLWRGSGRYSHATITKYAFFYMFSILLALILLSVYVVPGMLSFLHVAFTRFNPGNPYFADSLLALLFFTFDLLLYGFALLRHHNLSHNTLFINMSLLAITAGSFVLGAVGLQWFSLSNDLFITIILSYLLGIVIAVIFESSLLFAYPFTKQHTIFESILLPVLAACVPVGVLFTVQAATVYAYALSLGVGMLTAIVLSHYSRQSA